MELFIQIENDVVVTRAKVEIRGELGVIIRFIRKGESLSMNGEKWTYDELVAHGSGKMII
jgi:hypothetical protein